MASTVLQVRVEEGLRAEAASIYEKLGIDLQTAVRIFLKRSVVERGLPFGMTLRVTVPVAVGSLTKEQFDAELQKGLDDLAVGRVSSADVVEAEMRGLYGA